MRWFGFACPALKPILRDLQSDPFRLASTIGCAFGLLAAIAWPAAPAFAQRLDEPSRIALVIGNADYPAAPMPTSVNDAALVAETLAQIGFDVTAMANVDTKGLARLLSAFETKARKATPDAVILVYLAGYGVQYDGETYFMPRDARIARGSDVPLAATRISALVKAIEAVPAKAHVFIEDLAHLGPYVMNDGMPLAGGLAPAKAAAGSLYATNAAPGAVAPVELPPYGAYARALAEMIQYPGLDLLEVFRRVRLRAGEYTNGAIVPWEDAQLGAPVALSGQPAAAFTQSPAPRLDTLSPARAYSEIVARDTLAGYTDFVRAFPNDALAPRVKLILAVRREASFWAAASQANSAAAYWTYMRRYPRLAHYYDARHRLAALAMPLEPPPRFEITLFADLPPPSAEETALLDRAAIIVADPDWTPIPPPSADLLPPSRSAFTDALPPPPILPAEMLPIPVPVALPASAPATLPGRISQPFVPTFDEVLAKTSRPARDTTIVTLDAGAKGLISRLTMTADNVDNSTITQTGANAVILSRTTITGDRRGATIVQTGPGGGVITKAVTWTASNGAQSTVIRNGGNQIIADIKRNEQGIVVSAVGVAMPRISMRLAPTIAPAPQPSQAPPQKVGLPPLKVSPPAPAELTILKAPPVTASPPIPSVPAPAPAVLPTRPIVLAPQPPMPPVAPVPTANAPARFAPAGAAPEVPRP